MDTDFLERTGAKRPGRGVVAIGTWILACFSSTPLFAQCTLNGGSSNCVLNGPLTVNTYSDAASTTTTANGTLTLAGPGAMSIQSFVKQNGNVTLTGTGTLTLSNAQLGTDSNGWTLNNAITIVGSGLIGSNGGPVFQNLSLTNSGTVDANVSASTLTIGGSGGSATNSGTFEATGGATLSLATTAALNNNGGNITSTGSGSTVNIGITIQGGTLNTSSGGLIQTSGTATLNGSTQGAITLSDGSTYTAGANTTTNVLGTLTLGSTIGSTLALTGNLRLTGNEVLNVNGAGAGVVTMTGGNIGTDSNGWLLTNQTGVTIQGSGTIGSNVGSDFPNLSLTNNGTIDANVANTLTIAGSGGAIVNSGTFEATAGGTLSLGTTATIQNFGTIKSLGSGSTVNVGTTIAGGTLTTSGTAVMQTSGTATLDALNLGAITLTDGSTYTAGASTTTSLQGTLNLGTTTGSTLALTGNLRLIKNATLSGPGVVNMTGGQIGTNSNGFTLNLSSGATIQGSGLIGSNFGTDFPNLSLTNSGTIDANVSASTLTIGGNGGAITNIGTFEATAGGTLILSTSSAIANNGGNITSSGTGSVVNVSTTIQGGTLNTSGGGVMQTSTAATLDGSVNAITISSGSTYTAASGLTSLLGTLNLGTATGGTFALSGQAQLKGTETLSGPGSVIMSGNAQFGGDSNGRTLINQTTIQGSGVIGSNVGALFSNIALSNSGTVNANSSGNTLSISGTNGTTNTGTLEATSGGILSLTSAVNNNGGNITAAGTGSTVNVNTTIQGGTLNTSSGGLMHTVTAATLDGTSQGAITISDGSTYTAGSGTLNTVFGNLILGTQTGGTLALGGQMRLTGTETLSGPGSLTMSAGSQIGTDSNGRTLMNQATIQGVGTIGASSGSLSNNLSVTNSGTILANGGVLSVAGTGTLTNTGTMQANAGATLLSSSALSTNTFSSNTLHTGTYNVFGAGPSSAGTIQVNGLGSGGGEIQHNAATILLSGLNSNFEDSTGSDALSAFLDNELNASFSILNGRNFSTSGAFADAGMVDIGSTDLFSVNGGSSNYTQSAGTTEDDGTLTAGLTSINGGLFEGTGTVNNGLINGGEVKPGDSPGTLTVNGSYTQTSNGDLLIQIGGTGISQYDILDVTGAANLSGDLTFAAINGFTPVAGNAFFFLDYGSLANQFSTANITFTGLNLAQGLTAQLLYGQGSNHNEAELLINGTVTASPEPSAWILFVSALGAVVAFRMLRARRSDPDPKA